MNELKETTKITEVKETAMSEESEAEKTMREAVESMAKKIRDQAFIQGARAICGASMGIMKKHLTKKTSPSLRDYERCFKELHNFLSVPLNKAAEEEKKTVSEEENPSDDGRSEETN